MEESTETKFLDQHSTSAHNILHSASLNPKHKAEDIP